jgi:hypothetical protein
VTAISYDVGLVKMPPGILAGVFAPKAYVAVIVNVSPFESEKYVDRGIEREAEL